MLVGNEGRSHEAIPRTRSLRPPPPCTPYPIPPHTPGAPAPAPHPCAPTPTLTIGLHLTPACARSRPRGHARQPGELIHGEAFSMFEAMSALEVGNPKMDAAVSPAASRPSLEDLLAQGAAPAQLPPQQLLAVLDRLLLLEASWHAGNSVMQTVYACLYMLRMDRWAAAWVCVWGGGD